MTQHKRCRQCQQFFQPDAFCFRCSVADWLLSLSRWQRLQLIWFLLHPPTPEEIEEDGEMETAVDYPHQSRVSTTSSSPKGVSHDNPISRS